jgi:hypothetical protein
LPLLNTKQPPDTPFSPRLRNPGKPLMLGGRFSFPGPNRAHNSIFDPVAYKSRAQIGLFLAEKAIFTAVETSRYESKML